MSGLLDEVLTANGGLERWRAVTALTAHGRFGGLLRSRFPENRMANVTVRVQLAEQHAVFHGFPQEDQQAVFDRGDGRSPRWCYAAISALIPRWRAYMSSTHLNPGRSLSEARNSRNCAARSSG
jgi:hypothetical protein